MRSRTVRRERTDHGPDARRAAGRTRRGGGAIVAYGAYGLGSALRFLVQLAFARMLGDVGFGRFVVARTWGETLASFADRGHGAAMLRILPELQERGRGGPYRRLLRHGLTATVVGAVLLSALAVGLARVLRPDDLALTIGLALVPLLAVVRVLRTVLTAQHRIHAAMLVTEVAQPIVLMATAAALFLAVRATAVWALASLALSLVLAGLVEVLLIRRALPPDSDHAVEGDDLRRPGLLGPMFVIQSTVIVYNAADVLIAEAVLGYAAAGVYAVALRIAGLVRNINNIVEQTAAPKMAAAHARGDHQGLQRIIDHSIGISLVPTLIGTAGIAATGWWLLAIFGPSFTDGYGPLLVLLAAQVIAAATGPSGNVLMMTDAHRTFATIQGVLVGVHIPLAWLLTSRFGLVGTAASTFAITATTNALIVAFTRRQRSLDVLPRWRHLRYGARTGLGIVRSALASLPRRRP